ncbi:hypothetical protein HU200_044918 [Digitaria exilis]|uniref:Uncharacterized protein n=1 Tax=Digitaria exilis TaxID=1010633 RepID=A0A835B1W4_9POAL|nr:hypothetical protein HU200_044918 [Digitaria exilis]
MDRCRLPVGVPSVRLSSRLQMIATYAADSAPSSSRHSARRGQHPPALTVDVRVVIRRHFPVVAVGPAGSTRRIAEKVAADIALRRRPSRKLREPESVERALAEEVLPLVSHPFDRGAMAAASKKISARVAAACVDPPVARGGARVLVIVDTFACPVVALRRRPPPPLLKLVPRRNVACCAPEGNCFVAGTETQRLDLELETKMPAKKPNPYGVIGDRRSKPAVEEGSKLEGWTPMEGCKGLIDSLSIFR